MSLFFSGLEFSSDLEQLPENEDNPTDVQSSKKP